MPVVEGRCEGGGTAEIPLTADGTAVKMSGVAGGGLPAGAATSANQTTIIGHLDGVETLIGATNTALADGTQRVKTSASSSTHAGTPVATSSTAAALTSQATTIGYILVFALAENTAPIFLARGAGVTTSTGAPLYPGDSIPLPCENANEWYAISAAAQNLRFVAV